MHTPRAHGAPHARQPAVVRFLERSGDGDLRTLGAGRQSGPTSLQGPRHRVRLRWAAHWALVAAARVGVGPGPTLLVRSPLGLTWGDPHAASRGAGKSDHPAVGKAGELGRTAAGPGDMSHDSLVAPGIQSRVRVPLAARQEVL